MLPKYIIEAKDGPRSKWRRVQYLKPFDSREAAQEWIDEFNNGGGQAVLRIVAI